MELNYLEEAIINRITYFLTQMNGNNISEEDCNISTTILNLTSSLVGIQEYLEYKNGGTDDGKKESE